jgi:spore coat polysaccharide biosynthesis protein SpsF
MGSTRLPGKALIPINDKPMLKHVVDRCRRVCNEVIVATTMNENDADIDIFCRDNKIKCYRGSEINVLDRYYQCAKKYEIDVVIRVTGDCPLIDPEIINTMLKFYMSNNYEFVTNGGIPEKRTYPRGVDTEIFSIDVLTTALCNSKESYQKEHVTPYMYEHSNIFYYVAPEELKRPDIRITVDTKEDLTLVDNIISNLKDDVSTLDVIKYLNDNPELIKINKDVKQKVV